VQYESQGKVIELNHLTRLYPAVLIQVNANEQAQVSLEWAKLKTEYIDIKSYILVFDIDPLGEIPENRIILEFTSEEALVHEMQRVAPLLN